MVDEKDDVQEDFINESEGVDEPVDTGVKADGKMGTDKREPAKPQSIRDSIKDAIKQESKTPEEKAEERNKNLEKAREVRKIKAEERKSASVVDTNTSSIDKPDTSKTANVGKDVSTPKTEVQPPNGWTKQAKALWDSLPDDIKQSVAKREKEASDGFKTYGEIKKKYDELDAVLAPRRAAIQRWGATEAQTVDRLFQWMEALSGPNKINSWVALGQNFGINLNDVLRLNQAGAGAATAAPQQTSQQPQAAQVPEAVKNYVESALGQVGQYLTNQREQAAGSYLSSWAQDKPHFEQVRRAMYGLISSGAVPLKDGMPDLDTAYQWACHADPGIRSELEAAAKEAAEAKAAEDAQKAEAARIVKLNSARRAASSIRPTAPTPPSSRASAGNSGKPQSARDSIKAAISELVGQ